MDKNQIDELMKNEIDAKCLDNRQQAFGFTNRGELIPCCWADTGYNRDHPTFQKLVKVSKIADHDSIEDILMTDEWIEFTENLMNGKGMPVCHHVCKKRTTAQHKKEIFIDDDGNPYVKRAT